MARPPRWNHRRIWVLEIRLNCPSYALYVGYMSLSLIFSCTLCCLSLKYQIGRAKHTSPVAIEILANPTLRFSEIFHISKRALGNPLTRNSLILPRQSRRERLGLVQQPFPELGTSLRLFRVGALKIASEVLRFQLY